MNPSTSVGVADIFVYLVVERAYVWVGGGAGTEGIALVDELFGGVREVWDHSADVAAGDMFPGEASEDAAEHLLTGGTGRGQLQLGKSLLCFPGEGVPIGLTKIGESAVWGFWAGHRENAAQLDEDREMIGVESGEGKPL